MADVAMVKAKVAAMIVLIWPFHLVIVPNGKTFCLFVHTARHFAKPVAVCSGTKQAFLPIFAAMRCFHPPNYSQKA
jgi:hypothetical protein